MQARPGRILSFLPPENRPSLVHPIQLTATPKGSASLPRPLYLFIPSARDVGDIIQGANLRLDSVLEVQLLRFHFHLATSWNTRHAERGAWVRATQDSE